MLKHVKASLVDLLGDAYVRSVCTARAALTGEDAKTLYAMAAEPVEFYPEAFARRQEELMDHIGEQLCEPAPDAVTGITGAPTDSFGAAQHGTAAPVNGFGCFRLGEDGRLYFAGKSEHYHIPLGHCFPGYGLVETAKKLGITNATHNNTRGYVTRLLEQKLIAAANGVEPGTEAFKRVLASREGGVLNRVINLETGSLACEAAIKMMLCRFYAIDGKPAPYQDRIPVFLVMGDNLGGIGAGYHGTTLVAQTLRGLWPEYRKKACEAGLYRVEPVAINDIASFRGAMERWNTPPYKTAGFLHELIMMNYSAIRQDPGVLRAAYELCRQTDTPVLCDEIQSSAWYGSFYLFRRYGLKPDFVSIGKGFPGGLYAASRVLVSGAYDNLNQFGALVTNGQEELASLAYLITMRFLSENADAIDEASGYYHQGLLALAGRYPALVAGVEGDGMMSALRFHRGEDAVAFAKRMSGEHCIDISVQTYKAACPPVALGKLPLITSVTMMDKLLAHMDACLKEA